MERITLQDLRDDAGRALESVGRTGEPVVITRYERPVAVLVGIDEWEELEAFRDSKDAAVIARSRAKGLFVLLPAALESLGVEPREVEALLADRADGAAASIPVPDLRERRE
ncbi:type II toxin-antitoxin system Phd/YefM family antitoxin [Solwaraspora sp. WMMB762]|uniref:type II toxin-antitoxin system Phd/YefM family antitoxin n=1 Tax=Solwaraspora sp. WMMB762 TaxID=3404120 RepID=UPI003B92FEEA